MKITLKIGILFSLFIQLFTNVSYFFINTFSLSDYRITYISELAEESEERYFKFGETLTFPTPTPVAYHTFSGWYLDNQGIEALNLTTMPARNMDVYAIWQGNQYTISYVTNGGNVINPQAIRYGSSLALPTPTRSNYSFQGWYQNVGLTTPFTLVTMPAQNITLYAKWSINTYTITFNTNGGNAISSQTVAFGAELTLPVPIRANYSFQGWYQNVGLTTPFTLVTMPAQNITLYSKWIEKQNVQVGFQYSALLLDDGTLKMWGYNEVGQLGNGTFVDSLLPINITNNFNLGLSEKIKEISLGFSHSSALTTLGRVFMWGYNNAGQLGNATLNNQALPIDITSRFSLNLGEKVEHVRLGGYHSLALTSSGRVFSWGQNDLGQLGDGTTINRNTPRIITSQFLLPTTEIVTKIYANSWNSSAITSLNRVFTWGNNGNYQIGNGNETSQSKPVDITSRFELASGVSIVRMMLGSWNASALTSNGGLYMWGGNYHYQLGDGTNTSQNKPILVTAKFGLSTNESITQTALVGSVSAVLTSNGRLFVWGDNSHGLLGDGTTTSRTSPALLNSQFPLLTNEKIISINISWGGENGYTFMVYTSNNRLFTWGNNDSGQLGDGTTLTRTQPVNITNNI
jgi:uncharacterized repeat protein (TIGR02543 family)